MNLLKGQLLLCTCSFLLIPFALFGQNHKLNAEQRKRMHEEKIDDAYLPNAFNNKKLSAPYPFDGNTASRIMSSTIYTTQVNVSSGGQNIIGDAANEPSIAVNPVNPNIISIGWRQFDNIASNFRQAGWSFTTDGGLSWTFPGVIEPGIFRSDPVLEYDTLGNFYYNSLTNTPDYFCKVFKSTDGGASWDTGTDAGGGDKQWMTIDRTNGVGSGNIYASWNVAFTTCAPGFFTRSTDASSSYEACTEVDGEPYWATLAVGNSGELYIAGGGNSDSLVVAKSLNAQNPGSTINWSPYVAVFMDGYLNGWNNVNPSGLLGQVSVDVDRSGGPGHDNVYILASMARISNNDPGDVMFSKSTDGGLTWSAPMKINDDVSAFNTQWFGTMSVAPNGRIDAVWLDTREDNFGLDSSALYYSYSIDEGVTWSVNEKMSPLFDPHIGYPNQQKMGDYFDMISDNNGAHLAWCNTLNGEQDAYYSFISPGITTAVNGTEIISYIDIFPNPTSGTLFIESNASGATLEIYNLVGELVYFQKLATSKSVIDIASHAPGIYFVKLNSLQGETIVKKIIKN